MFFRRTPEVLTADQALPGRSTPIVTPGTHLVLGTPMGGPVPGGLQELYVGMGCFWGAERIFWQIPGVYTTAAGYTGGLTPHPTYEETCTGLTGHTEAVRVVYDPAQVDIEILLKAFWENHDPTQLNGQGNDHGTQYRTAIYPTTDEQLAAARESQVRYQAALTSAGYGEITTEIRPFAEAGPWFYAEEYHQQYLAKHPNGYCNHGFCQERYDAAAHGQSGRVELPTT
ncbi:MAG: Peptide methionine sulfoxide reductase MsrA [Frankiales bacterium]|nr:Peptide methionine sulfoxide reductase MsrA [Frankiales bacterium]